MIPCHDRPSDLDLLADDLRRLELVSRVGPIAFDAVIVDNASARPLPAPRGLDATVIRLPANAGGSGGFNAGLRHLLSTWSGSGGAQPGELDFLWLIDSDARVRPDTLRLLVDVLHTRQDLVAVGPSLADPADARVHEVGGMVDRRTGVFGPAPTSLATIVPCDYVASCCALVRRSAVERVGLMPDRFLNADDVEWFIRLARVTGLKIAAVRSATALHPRFDRFPTGARFFGARNMMGPVGALGLSAQVRFKRAFAETGKAINQALMGRADLARLHELGIREAAAGRTTGPAPHDALAIMQSPLQTGWDRFAPAIAEEAARIGRAPTIRVHPSIDLAGHAATAFRAGLSGVGVSPPPAGGAGVRSAPALRGVFGAFARLFVGPGADLAVVPAEGRPAAWLCGTRTITVSNSGFAVIHTGRWANVRSAIQTARACVIPVLRLALREPRTIRLPLPPRPKRAAGTGLSIVVLSYNRRTELERTLRALVDGEVTREAEVIVADNGSRDGSGAMVRELFPSVRLLDLRRNLGVAGFNRAVEVAKSPYVLILDDDAVPDQDGLKGAIAALDNDEQLGAVALHPVHPSGLVSEWPFAGEWRENGVAPTVRSDWPVMGSGNLVRRSDWLSAAGYEEAFFLYRNDTDLAMRLLHSGLGVAFNPRWVVWHDSPATARKSVRWFETATRNWLWLARRHGRGISGVAGALMGWAWAHRLAGLSPSRQFAALRGALAGLLAPKPPLRSDRRPDGAAFASLLRLQLATRFKKRS